MKFPGISKISKEVKQTMLGGALAGAVVGAESGMSWFVAGYPQMLKDKLNPNLPRNGALIANLVPAGYGLMVKKKGRGSPRTQNMANGMVLFDLPNLLDQFVYNIAYEMGRPAPTAGGMRFNNGLRSTSFRPMVNRAGMASYAKVGSGTGKYTMKTSNVAKTAMSSGIGKYR